MHKERLLMVWFMESTHLFVWVSQLKLKTHEKVLDHDAEEDENNKHMKIISCEDNKYLCNDNTYMKINIKVVLLNFETSSNQGTRVVFQVNITDSFLTLHVL